MLNNFDKNYLIKRFPDIHYHFIKNIQSTYKADTYLAVPKGRKYFAWFTFHKTNPICVFLEFKNNEIVNCLSYDVCCDSELFYDTILYGTMFYMAKTKTNYFTTEDIYKYKGTSINRLSFHYKLGYLNQLYMNDIQQKSYTKNMVVFGMPLINTSYDALLTDISTVPYSIYSIQHITLNKPTKQLRYIQQSHAIIPHVNFIVEADINNDIYHLYCMDNDQNKQLYDSAIVNDYQDSVRMNALFRKIKENQNLDAIEESESEEEFEEISDTKYILQKSIIMQCEYKPDFNKWKPIKVVDININDKNTDEKIVTKQWLLSNQK